VTTLDLPYLEANQTPTSTEWNLMLDAIQAVSDRTQIVDKGTDQFASSATTGTTLVDAAGLSVFLGTGKRYTIEGKLFYAADAGGDLKIGFTGPSGMSISYSLFGLPAADASINNIDPRAYSSGSAIVGGVGNGTPLFAFFEATVHTDFPGDFQLQMAQGSSHANFTVVYANSSLRAIEA
jgi:hypothetical protein